VTRRKRRAQPAREEADCGPPERANRGELTPRATGIPGVAARRVKFECRLDWYQEKGSINDRQHAAGIRFRRDWQLAAASTKVIGTYGLRMPGGGEFREAQIAARRRAAKAITMLETDLARIVIDVCGYDNWAAARLPALREALTRLADHYGMPRERLGG